MDKRLCHLFTVSSLCRQVSPFHRPQRPLGRVEVQLYSIFDFGTRRGKGSASRPVESLYSAVILLIYVSLNDTFSISPYKDLSYKVTGE